MWRERRNQLKKDICNYFINLGADKQKLIKICKFIKDISVICAAPELEGYHEEYLEEEISSNFSADRRKVIRDFCDRAIQLDLELRDFLDGQRWWKDPKSNWARDDFEYEDYLDSLPKAEILITYDEIIIHSFEWQEEFKERLPKGGKYLEKGSGKWRYPLSARSQLEKFGLPIVKYPDIS